MLLRQINNKVVFSDPKIEKQKQHTNKLKDMADKKDKRELTLEDIYEQNKIIIEILYDIIKQ